MWKHTNEGWNRFQLKKAFYDEFRQSQMTFMENQLKACETYIQQNGKHHAIANNPHLLLMILKLTFILSYIQAEDCHFLWELDKTLIDENVFI